MPTPEANSARSAVPQIRRLRKHHRRLVEGELTLARPLRCVHRDVRAGEQVVQGRRRLSGGHLGDADAGPDGQLFLAQGERRAEGFDQSGAEFDAVGVLALGQHRELVTAEAGDGVARPQRADQPLTHGDQQPVADGVPDALVDDLEPIEVEEHDRDRRGGPGIR